MKKKKTPMRQCVVTNIHFPKEEMFRIVRTSDGRVEVDLTGKTRGRGAYLSKQKDTIQKAIKTKILDKHLGIAIPLKIYDQLMQLLVDDNEPS